MARQSMWACVALLVSLAEAHAGTLRFQFIGNEAFLITDGTSTLLTDFPYQSGAFGYMEYRMEDVRPEGEVLCLITHRHADHFDPKLFLETTWKILGPDEVTRSLPKERVVPLHESVETGPWKIRAIATPHASIEHYSYEVTWDGVRLFFAGDSESLVPVLEEKKVDVLFITPWLRAASEKEHKKLKAKKVVLYHQTDTRVPLSYRDIVVMRQGETFTLDTR